MYSAVLFALYLKFHELLLYLNFSIGFEITIGVKNLKNGVNYIVLFTSVDKRIWLLIWAQACVQFSVAVFWILWAPTVVVSFLLLISKLCLTWFWIVINDSSTIITRKLILERIFST